MNIKLPFIIITFLCLGGISFYGLTKFGKPQTVIVQSHIQEFENFNQGTEITIIYNDRKESHIDVSNKIERQKYNGKTQKFTYIIKDQSDILDVEVIQSNIITANISGLSSQAKVQWITGNKALTPSVPVDWAGRISLKVPKSTEQSSLCLKICNTADRKQNSKICYLRTEKEAA